MLAMTQVIDLAVLAILSVQAQGQAPTLEVLALITDAAKACEGVHTAAYAACYRWDRPGGQQPIVLQGEASFAKWGKASGHTGPAASPAIKGKSRLGASVRIDLKDGRCFAYNGEQSFVVNPESKKLLSFAVEDFADRNSVESTVTGNIAGALVQTALLDPMRLT